jgi:cytochrome b involved in lipid metabolism
MKELRLPPRWWIKQEQELYSEQLVRWRQVYEVQAEQWKLFYFMFGQHWAKFAVMKHRNVNDCWLVIHGTIFDVTDFGDHPGRMEPFGRYACQALITLAFVNFLLL